MYITCIAASEFITRCKNFTALQVPTAALSPFELHFPSVPVPPLDPIMASNAKTVLVFMLLLATVMAAQANKVSCKNQYCKPITVNGVLIEVGAVVDVVVDAAGTLVVEVTGLLGVVLKQTYLVPSDVTEVAIVKVALGLVVEVLAAVTTTVGSLLDGILNLTLQLC